MSHRTKSVIGNGVGALGLIGALYGLQHMYGAVLTGKGGKLAAGILLLSVVVGIVGFMTSRVQRVHASNEGDPDKLAVETLAKLGRAMQQKTIQETTQKKTSSRKHA